MSLAAARVQFPVHLSHQAKDWDEDRHIQKGAHDTKEAEQCHYD
jgi:hypothetical protein